MHEVLQRLLKLELRKVKWLLLHRATEAKGFFCLRCSASLKDIASTESECLGPLLTPCKELVISGCVQSSLCINPVAHLKDRISSFSFWQGMNHEKF